jgi:hypothetical protein
MLPACHAVKKNVWLAGWLATPVGWLAVQKRQSLSNTREVLPTIFVFYFIFIFIFYFSFISRVEAKPR